MTEKLLIVGFSTRHVACSAFSAGYHVYALDNFCDQDLSWYTKNCFRFENLDEIADMVQDICSRFPIDAVLVTSGAESLKPPVTLHGTDSETVGRFLDKLETERFFQELDVKRPALLPSGKYPAFLKPRSGSGGWRNKVVSSAEEEQAWIEKMENPPFLRQEIVSGTPASVSCISDGIRAVAVSGNEQILRGPGESEFGYAGSITPFDNPLEEKMKKTAEYIVSSSGCRGSVGVDFIVDRNEVRVIEINPRFQATLDTVEEVTGENLVNLHINACKGQIGEYLFGINGYAARKIFFAERDCMITGNLKDLYPAVADIPWPGTHFEEGDAVISVLGRGTTKQEALASLDITIRRIQQYIR